MTRLQSPPLMEPANSWAHHQWQLLLVLPPTTRGIDVTAVHWLKSVLAVAPPLLPTSMDAVELLSISDKQKMKVIVKVILTLHWLHYTADCSIRMYFIVCNIICFCLDFHEVTP